MIFFLSFEKVFPSFLARFLHCFGLHICLAAVRNIFFAASQVLTRRMFIRMKRNIYDKIIRRNDSTY